MSRLGLPSGCPPYAAWVQTVAALRHLSLWAQLWASGRCCRKARRSCDSPFSPHFVLRLPPCDLRYLSLARLCRCGGLMERCGPFFFPSSAARGCGMSMGSCRDSSARERRSYLTITHCQWRSCESEHMCGKSPLPTLPVRKINIIPPTSRSSIQQHFMFSL